MATKIKIGQASISENGTIFGNPGDQTGQEVYIRDYDSISWLNANVLLRPKSQHLAEISARACEAGCNNPNIGYSQGAARNTLYAKAVEVGFDLSKITTACSTDCSSFMTVCAIAGGVTTLNGNNAPVTGTMATAFEKSGSYVRMTDTNHLTKTDYLKRGDILVRENGHTLMVLSNGSNYEDVVYNDISNPNYNMQINDNLPEQIKFVNVNITEILATEVEVVSKLVVKESNSGKVLNNNLLKNYTWSYKVKSIDNDTEKTIQEEISVASGSKSVQFTVANLMPNTYYFLEVIAKKKKGNEKLSSQNVIFITARPCPDPIKNLTVNFGTDDFLNRKCNISFKAPNSWNAPLGYTTGYRISLLVNGKIIAFNDSLIKPESSVINKTIQLRELVSQVVFDYTDILQIGIQTWIKDSQNNIFFDSAFPKCSQPFYIKPWLSVINNIYIKIKGNFKRTILFNIIKGV